MQKYIRVLHKDNDTKEIKESDVISLDEYGLIYRGNGFIGAVPRSSIEKLFGFKK